MVRRDSISRHLSTQASVAAYIQLSSLLASNYLQQHYCPRFATSIAAQHLLQNYPCFVQQRCMFTHTGLSGETPPLYPSSQPPASTPTPTRSLRCYATLTHETFIVPLSPKPQPASSMTPFRWPSSSSCSFDGRKRNQSGRRMDGCGRKGSNRR